MLKYDFENEVQFALMPISNLSHVTVVYLYSVQERFRLLVEADDTLSKWASVPRVVPELGSKEVNEIDTRNHRTVDVGV